MSQQQKRKKDDVSEELTGREKKKARMAEARSIPVQAAGVGLSQAGPSEVVPMNSLVGLPSAIDIEKVVESRSFEISAMQTAMKTARSEALQIFLPIAKGDYHTAPAQRKGHGKHSQGIYAEGRRVMTFVEFHRGFAGEHLQRRMDALPVKKKKLPRRGKANQESRTESFLRRQKDKTWLETHVWHAKRMHMENMWGYRLAVKPTEKAYRPSHRASQQDSIVHDASYFSLVELKGAAETIIGTLTLCCDPQGPSPGASRFISGARTHETHIYEPKAYPFGLISPVSIVWRPIPELAEPLKKGKGKESGVPALLESSPDKGRAAWLRFHPTVHQTVLSALQSAASQYLAGKKAEGVEGVEIEISDLKDQINVFEVMGPQASQVIRGALSAVSGDSREEFQKFWSSLGDIQTSGSVPRNMVIGFKVLDPRLRFPPKRTKPKPGYQQSSDHIFPSVSLARSDIWDESVRLGLAKPKYTKQQLDERRANNIIPGTPLNPQRQDDRVPVLLVQRSLEASQTSGGHPIHGWTLIIPSGWGMAFWNSLIFTGTRVAGQRERQTQAYEAGTSYFPRDYPFTAAYQQFSSGKEDEYRATWERKPPAKRTNFEKLQVQDPWSPNWLQVLQIKPESVAEGVDLVSTQREAAEPTVKPWLLRGSKAAKITERLTLPATPRGYLVDEINRLRTARSLGPLSATINSQALLQGALLTVKIKMCGRGLPHDLALIYSMDDEEITQAVIRSNEDSEDEEFEAPSSALVGRVTTGNFSLTIGSGYAVGAVPLAKWLELVKQPMATANNGPASPYVKLRNTNSDQCRLAQLELLIEGDA